MIAAGLCSRVRLCLNRGVAGRLRTAFRSFPRSSPRPSLHPFDLKHRVDTSGLLYADDLSSGHRHDRHSEGYYGTAPSLFHSLVSRWEQTLPAAGLSLPDYSFVDLGCGKGRVLMMASEYRFRSIAGVELNPVLARVAQKNLAGWMRSPRACEDIRVLHEDVLSAPLPDGPAVLYCFNSFEREMVRLLLHHLAEDSMARCHPIDLLYVHPDHSALVRQTPGMELLLEESIAFSPEDAAADVFGVGFDRCCAYRLTRSSEVDNA